MRWMPGTCSWVVMAGDARQAGESPAEAASKGRIPWAEKQCQVGTHTHIEERWSRDGAGPRTSGGSSSHRRAEGSTRGQRGSPSARTRAATQEIRGRQLAFSGGVPPPASLKSSRSQADLPRFRADQPVTGDGHPVLSPASPNPVNPRDGLLWNDGIDGRWVQRVMLCRKTSE